MFYVECHHAECRYAECHGTFFPVLNRASLNLNLKLKHFCDLALKTIFRTNTIEMIVGYSVLFSSSPKPQPAIGNDILKKSNRTSLQTSQSIFI
jgi:hypothetical protein